MLLGAHSRNESFHLDNVELDESTKHTLSQQYVMIGKFYLTPSSLNWLGTVIKYIGQINW